MYICTPHQVKKNYRLKNKKKGRVCHLDMSSRSIEKKNILKYNRRLWEENSVTKAHLLNLPPKRPTQQKKHRPTLPIVGREKVSSTVWEANTFGIIEAHLRTPLKPLHTVVLWWSGGYQGVSLIVHTWSSVSRIAVRLLIFHCMVLFWKELVDYGILNIIFFLCRQILCWWKFWAADTLDHLSQAGKYGTVSLQSEEGISYYFLIQRNTWRNSKEYEKKFKRIFTAIRE